MLSTPHLLVGAAIGAATGNPALGYAGGVLSHFVLDAIPHTDQELLEQPGKGTIMPADYAAVIVDILLGIGLVWYVSTFGGTGQINMYAGALGGISPDLLNNVPFWSPTINKWPGVAQFFALHDAVNHHNLSEQSKLLGVVTQFAAIALAVLVLVKCL